MPIETQPIATVLVDLSEVLLTGLKGTEDRLAADLLDTPDEIHRQLHHPALGWLFLGHIFEEQYWQHVIADGKWGVDAEWCRRVVRENFREIEGVRPIIIDLRRAGYRIGLVSNHAREWVADCQSRFNHEDEFDDCVYSYAVGAVKPERQIYLRAMERLHADPATTLLIDDAPENLLPARDLGMHVLQFLTPHQLKTDLVSKKVLAE